jgi:ribosomal protein S18 acetylase RimI-like enzyme
LSNPIKPQSIRVAIVLLYIRLAISIAVIALNTKVILFPTADEIEKFKLDELTSVQILWAYLNLLLPVLVVIFTIRFINRRQRLLAILAALIVVWMSGSFHPLIEMFIGVVVFLLLLVRSSSAYFAGRALAADAPGRTADFGSGHSQEQPEAAGWEWEDAGSQDNTASPAAASRLRHDPVIEIRQAGPEDAETIHALMIQAFEEYRMAVPPSSALKETVESVRDALLHKESAAILLEDGVPVAMVRYEIAGDTIHFSRLSVIPARRRRGYAKRLVKWIEQLGVSKGLYYSRCKVRQSVQNNVAMYQNMGYEIVHQELAVRPEGTVKILHLEKNVAV